MSTALTGNIRVGALVRSGWLPYNRCMSVHVTRRRSGPIYRQCGDEVISYVLEKVVWKIRLPWVRRELFRVVRESVYIIDGDGVRRRERHLRVEIGGVGKR